MRGALDPLWRQWQQDCWLYGTDVVDGLWEYYYVRTQLVRLLRLAEARGQRGAVAYLRRVLEGGTHA